MKKKLFILFLLSILITVISTCDNKTKVKVKDQYLNLHDTIEYVGMETCRTCHADKFNTFIKTGMGSSFGIADTLKSIANLGKNSFIHDPHLNFHYHPFWLKDSLYLEEFRLSGTDTVFKLQQKVDYVIGSGQHTNSHIFAINGYAFQLPFTWYAQERILDLPPGYEDGANSRMERIIGLECMSCHNAMPTGFVKGSENKFSSIPNGINCERCHGPGEAHVKKVTSGNLTDTSKAIDYSIVNPAKLSVELQFEVCQRCHLQGNAVLGEGKSFFDFKPGMRLNEVMDVYLPRYENAEDKFIMASHVDRFKKSKCFIESEGYTCTTCHDPHVSVVETNTIRFNNVCKSCHMDAPRHQCDAPISELELKNYNCVECHMPSSGSIDIPHVTVHDHYVRQNMPKNKVEEIGRFLGLQAVNNKKPSNRSKALAYLQQYERFQSKDFYLDSAHYFLKKIGKQEHLPLWINYYFLKGDYINLIKLAEAQPNSALSVLTKESYDNFDAWSAYRVGEAYMYTNRLNEAFQYFKRAVTLAPFVADFRNKYGVSLLRMQKIEEAASAFEQVLEEFPYHKEAMNNLGYCYLLQGNFTMALKYFDKALQRDPDYILAWLNKANVYLQLEEKQLLEKSLNEVLRINPNHPQALEIINSLKNS